MLQLGRSPNLPKNYPIPPSQLEAVKTLPKIPEIQKSQLTSAERRDLLEKAAAAETVEIKKISELYLKAAIEPRGLLRTYRFALANDQVLRSVMKKPFRDPSSLDSYFVKLRRDVERQSSELRGEERSEIINTFDGHVKKSIDQLLPFVERQRELNPNDVFATGIRYDVDYGVDLIRGRPTFQSSEDQLRINIDLYQAKSGKTDAGGIELLARTYLSKARESKQTATLDTRWIEQRIATESLELPTDDELMDILAGDAKKIEAYRTSDEPLKQYAATVRIAEASRILGEKLGLSGLKPPSIALGKVDYRLLVRGPQGMLDISIDEVLTRASK